MSHISQYKDLSEFLAKHNAKQDKSSVATHTRIPDKNLSIHGGAYVIPKEDIPTFMELYYDAIFVKKKHEYLTEKQLESGAPLLVDLDFRYSYDVEERLHTNDHITDIILLYLEKLKGFFSFEKDKAFDVFVMHKPHVNRLDDKSLTKDGIHIYFGIQMDHVLQSMLRDKIMDCIADVFELPLINDWNSVLDETISKGTTNWQLYGSKKPGNEAYALTHHFSVDFDPKDGEFMMDEISVKDFDFSKNLMRLSARYEQNVKFELNPSIIQEYNEKMLNKNKKIKKPISKAKVKLLCDADDENDDDAVNIYEITNKDQLDRAVNSIMKSLKPSEYGIKEIHQYTQILPEKYYEPGSHLINREVAFALKNTDDRLFLSWVLLRSKASDFTYDSIPDLYMRWKKHFNVNCEGITKRTIIFWAKQDAYDDYIKVKNSTVDQCIEDTIYSPTEFDFATVLHFMFKDRYVCASIEHRLWYVFRNHHWERDNGMSLRMAISKDMHKVYQDKIDENVNEMQHYDPNDDRSEYLKKKNKTLSEISIKFKKTNEKNNIMREAMEIFYDSQFIKNIDANKYLLCFNNGVVDFKNKVFRSGYPQDYITKSTNIPYLPLQLDNPEHITIQNEIVDFMEKLFPQPTLNKYMWEHLSSSLIGVNINQTFNIYRGSGKNGKSKLTELMTMALGEYKGTVPITLVTEKRNCIGGTSSEIIQLKGVRYAVMQEPSKDAKINEGVMKELTGGDPLQGRALYAESETFNPQFTLVVCTNSLFEINSNDDGTWRRIRIVDFLSKFMADKEMVHSEKADYVFPEDKNLDQKLPIWAPLFAYMLVQKAFDTEGIVKDCDEVLASSNKYRQGQDHISGFIGEMVVKTDDSKDRIKKKELSEQFKVWFQDNQGFRKMPKGSELYEYMDKKFGKCKTTGWSGVKILYPTVEDELNELDGTIEEETELPL